MSGPGAKRIRIASTFRSWSQLLSERVFEDRTHPLLWQKIVNFGEQFFCRTLHLSLLPGGSEFLLSQGESFPDRRKFLKQISVLAAGGFSTLSRPQRTRKEISGGKIRSGSSSVKRWPAAWPYSRLLAIPDRIALLCTWTAEAGGASAQAIAAVSQETATQAQASRSAPELEDKSWMRFCSIATLPGPWHDAGHDSPPASAGKPVVRRKNRAAHHPPRAKRWCLREETWPAGSNGQSRRSWPWVIEAINGGSKNGRGSVNCFVWRGRGTTTIVLLIGKGKPAPVPEWLDYSLWHGPAPDGPPGNIFITTALVLDLGSTANLGNNGVHFLDLAPGAWGRTPSSKGHLWLKSYHHFKILGNSRTRTWRVMISVTRPYLEGHSLRSPRV